MFSRNVSETCFHSLTSEISAWCLFKVESSVQRVKLNDNVVLKRVIFKQNLKVTGL